MVATPLIKLLEELSKRTNMYSFNSRYQDEYATMTLSSKAAASNCILLIPFVYQTKLPLTSDMISNVEDFLQRPIIEGTDQVTTLHTTRLVFFTCSEDESNLLKLTFGNYRFVHYQDIKDDLGL